MLRSLLAVALCVSAATPSFSATVEVISGKVSLNQGKGFKVIATLSEAKPGDRVLVENGGSANIVYADGCTIKLGDPVKRSTITIPVDPPCGAGLLPTTGTIPPAVVTGVVVAGVVAGAVVIAASSGRDKPSSP